MARRVQGGGRYLIYLRLDGFARLEKELGVLRSEDFLVALAALLRPQLAPTDLAGHFSGAGIMVLAERGTPRDAEVWVQRLLDKIAQHGFEISGQGFGATACAALAPVPVGSTKLDVLIGDAQDAVRRARTQGGNRLVKVGQNETEARAELEDASWVKEIRAALAANRFTLVQQPITSLSGGAPLVDTVVRMTDALGKEILPSEFMPAAERSGLIALIDRWVIAQAMRLAQASQAGCVFARISRHSALEASLPAWVAHMLQTKGLQPARFGIQVTESVTASNPADILRLATALKGSGVRFVLEALPLDFVKIDGSLMQGLTTDKLLQSKVGSLIEAARERGIETIAERVEDANTLAVLWQLGVQHVQGFLFQSTEEVTIS
jgi:EAL domain-containing protein (putative c-di-GMP-specific phosphodiesterase class I)/GGDEF domain-containing protein